VCHRGDELSGEPRLALCLNQAPVTSALRLFFCCTRTPMHWGMHTSRSVHRQTHAVHMHIWSCAQGTCVHTGALARDALPWIMSRAWMYDRPAVMSMHMLSTRGMSGA
jgi:hypothetical protein